MSANGRSDTYPGRDSRVGELCREAKAVRERHFGNSIFLYGFVYFSTYCVNNCNFCYYRRDNDIARYRKSPGETIEHAKRLADSGVVLIDLTSGEDAVAFGHGDAALVDLLREVKAQTGLPVMVSPGVVKRDTVSRLAGAGADFLALYQETHNRELFAVLRPGQDYDERMRVKADAHYEGMLIEEGLLTGIGETEADLAHSLSEMGRLGAEQMRVMSFVPQQGTPMYGHTPGDRLAELEMIARMRLAYPEALIPASLDVDGIAGLCARINAGANVVTSIIPPNSGLRGVAHADLDINEGGRTVFEVTEVLASLGLEPGKAGEYKDLIDSMKERRRAE